MNTRGKTILVTGATGKQGGSVARHLLAEGWTVRALTRNPEKREARELRMRGAEVVRGDLNDESSLWKAMNGAYGVYSVQTFMEQGVRTEARQGISVANAARDAGVRHFVYSSVASADGNTGIPHFESKWRVEEYIRVLGLPATIVRPAFFMENFITVPDWRSGILEGRLSMALRPETRLQMVALDDIGAVVSEAFRDRDPYLGRALEIAGDELTGPDIAATFARVLRKPVIYEELPVSEVGKYNEDLAIMYEWFNTTGLNVNIRAARMMHPGLRTFEAWVRETIWSLVPA